MLFRLFSTTATFKTSHFQSDSSWMAPFICKTLTSSLQEVFQNFPRSLCHCTNWDKWQRIIHYPDWYRSGQCPPSQLRGSIHPASPSVPFSQVRPLCLPEAFSRTSAVPLRLSRPQSLPAGGITTQSVAGLDDHHGCLILRGSHHPIALRHRLKFSAPSQTLSLLLF